MLILNDCLLTFRTKLMLEDYKKEKHMIEVHHGWDKTHIDISHNGTQIKTIEQ